MKNKVWEKTIFLLLLLLEISIVTFVTIQVVHTKLLDPVLKYTGLGLLILIIVALIFIALKFKTKHKIIILVAVLFVLINIIIGFGSSVLSNVNSLVNQIVENKQLESNYTLIVNGDSDVLSIEDLANKNIGVLNDNAKNEIMITLNKENLPFKYLYVDHFLELIDGLLDGTYDAIVVPSDYQSYFIQDEEILTKTENFKSIFGINVTILIQNTTEIINRDDSFNILLIGSDSSFYGNYDVILLVSVNPKDGDIAITSIPRDTYLNSTCIGGMDKINHTGWVGKGPECLMSSLEENFDTNIDYYMLVNFYRMMKVVDVLGGITVDVPYYMCEQTASRTSSAKICLKPGIQKLNGAQALAFARNRKNVNSNAIVRSKNHITVLEAIIDNMLSTNMLVNYDKILDIIGKNIYTNINEGQIYNFYNAGNDIFKNYSYDELNIQRVSIDGHTASKYSTSLKCNASMYIPTQESLDYAKTIINYFSGDITKLPDDFEYKEYIEVPHSSYIPRDNRKIITLINLEEAQTWAKDIGINLEITYEFNDSYDKDKVISQELAAGSYLDFKKSFKITVSKGSEADYIVTLPDMSNWYYKDILTYAKDTFTKYTIVKETTTEYHHNQFIRLEPTKRPIYYYDNVTLYVFSNIAEVETTPPTITLTGDTEITLNLNEEFEESGFAAFDEIDWYITDTVIINNTIDNTIPGIYTITYSVTNSNDLTTEVNRTITIVDNIAPEIVLNQGEEITLALDTIWEEPEGVVSDNVTDLTWTDVVITGDVDTSIAGTYIITYSVNDAASNNFEITRTVIVE